MKDANYARIWWNENNIYTVKFYINLTKLITDKYRSYSGVWSISYGPGSGIDGINGGKSFCIFKFYIIHKYGTQVKDEIFLQWAGSYVTDL
jgi:hypothetical protein